MIRRARVLLALVLCLSLGCGQNGGCGGDFGYPRSEPEAALTGRALRMRITQAGMDTIAAAVPSLMLAACEGNPADATAACALDPADPNRVRFYVSQAGSPATFSGGEIREGGFLAFELDSLAGNVHADLVDVADGPDGIQLTIGCDAPNFADCTGVSYVDGSIDLVLFVQGRTIIPSVIEWNDSACFVQDDAPPQPGLTIESFRFTIYPRIDPVGPDARPYLVVNDAITVNRMHVELRVQAGDAVTDPVVDCSVPGNCDLCEHVDDWIIPYVLEPLIETGVLGDTLAQQLADVLFGQFADTALDIEGEFGVEDLTTIIGNPTANRVGYRVAANNGSPHVTGATGELGLNFDFDSGFVADHSPCAPIVTPPSWVVPDQPDLGATVIAPDPVTGLPGPELFDMAFLVGDVFFGRALFELFDGGSVCIRLTAEGLADMTGGAFVPTPGSLEAIAPGLLTLAAHDAPVDLVLAPRYPPVMLFGTGAGEGEQRDSHLQLVWPSLSVELYPLVDDNSIRALALAIDLDAGMSFEPTPDGDLVLVIDHILLANVVETQNEMNLRFDPAALADLIGLFLPSLMGEPINIELTAALLGFPFVPKVRAIEAAGANERFLAIYTRFCTPEQIADPGNALCYEDPSGAGSGNAPGSWLGAERASGPGGALPSDTMRIRAYSSLPSEALELAFVVDNLGPLFGFRGPDADGLFTLEHPLLALSGLHTVTLVGRDRSRPGAWTQEVDLVIVADHTMPHVVGWREPGGIRTQASDNLTPPERLEVNIKLAGANGSRFVASLSGELVFAEPDERATLRARDETGNLSDPFVVAAHPSHTLAEHSLEPTVRDSGCTAARPVGWVVALLAGALVARSRRRRRYVPGS